MIMPISSRVRADTTERVGQARATQRGWLTPSQTAGASTACLVLALAIAIPMVLDLQQQESTTNLLWFILISSCFNAVAYTGGPYPLGYIGLGRVSIAYSGLGDVFCFVYFGFVAVLTIPYIAAVRSNHYDVSNTPIHLVAEPQQQQTLVALIPMLQPLHAFPAALLSTAILVVNNLRDRHTDLKANKRTLAVRFGALFCKLEYTFLVVAAYGIPLYRFWLMPSSLWFDLLPLLTIPLALTCTTAMWTREGRYLNPYMGQTALLELFYCILQSIAIVLTKRQML